MAETQIPALDAQALNDNTMSNRALQQELFQIFFDQAAHYVDSLREAAAMGDASGWRMAAHGLKGSALALGLSRLARLSSEAEKGSPARSAAEAVERALAGAEDAARRYLAGLAGRAA